MVGAVEHCGAGLDVRALRGRQGGQRECEEGDEQRKNDACESLIGHVPTQRFLARVAFGSSGPCSCSKCQTNLWLGSGRRGGRHHGPRRDADVRLHGALVPVQPGPGEAPGARDADGRRPRHGPLREDLRAERRHPHAPARTRDRAAPGRPEVRARAGRPRRASLCARPGGREPDSRDRNRRAAHPAVGHSLALVGRGNLARRQQRLRLRRRRCLRPARLRLDGTGHRRGDHRRRREAAAGARRLRRGARGWCFAQPQLRGLPARPRHPEGPSGTACRVRGSDRDGAAGGPRRRHAAGALVELRRPPDVVRRRQPAVLGRQRRDRRSAGGGCDLASARARRGRLDQRRSG